MSENMAQLPKYRCHKEVWALKIEAIRKSGEVGGPALHQGGATLVGTGMSVDVDGEYLVRHQPEVGGYYVRYEDGYQSFSPAAAFESGYTRIEP